MKKIIFLKIISFVFCFEFSAQITSTEADEIVLEHILQEMQFYTVYAKDSVQSEMTITTTAGETVELDYNCWVYYIGYTNAGRYLIINEINGNLLEVNTISNAVHEDLAEWREVHEFCKYFTSENIDKIIPVINRFLEKQSPSELIAWLKSYPCINDATVFCIGCIFPAIRPLHEKIIVSFDENGTEKYVILDILLSFDPCRIVSYYETGNMSEKLLRGIWMQKNSYALSYIDFYSDVNAKFVYRIKNVEAVDDYLYLLYDEHTMLSINQLREIREIIHNLTFVNDNTIKISGLTDLLHGSEVTYQKYEQLTIGQGDTINLGYRHLYYDMEKDFRMQIDSISNDSRCPNDLTCIWEGNVEVHLHLMYNGNNESKFTLNLNPVFQADTIIGNLYFRLLSVEPDLESGKTIAQSDYMITILVSSNADDSSNTELTELEGTVWKFEGIVDTQTGEVKKLHPENCDDCYTFTFINDAVAIGYLEKFAGYREGVSIDLTLLGQVMIDSRGRPDDGYELIRAIWSYNTRLYSITATEMKIINDTDNYYLLFKRIYL